MATDPAARWRELVWFIKGVVGANRYETYKAHHYATGCNSPLMSEKEFWRHHMDEQDRSPQMRCC